MKFHRELGVRVYLSFEELEKVIEGQETPKSKGDLFEDFVWCYFKLRSQKYQINEVYRLQDAPKDLLKKFKIETSDSGVDGVFTLNNGKVAGYQVKFRTGRSKPKYEELAKFWIESKHTHYKYTVTNAYDVTRLAEKQEGHYSVLVQEFEDLDKDFFQSLFDLVNGKQVTRRLNDPYDFQNEIISDVVKGFESFDRGKYIAACGTGKTLTSLWISERLDCQSVLFIAPSLALIKQTLDEWANQSKDPFEFLCVCSDVSVARSAIEDYGDIAISDFDVPVTTETAEIVSFLRSNSDKKKFVFSTYQSLDIVAGSLEEYRGYEFDLTIFDEAHRTAGARDSEMFSLGLNDDFIASSKRLFMTATERMVMPSLKKKAEEENRAIFSMDDETIYGPTFHRLDFGKAIEKKIISDYKIVVAAIREREIFEWIVNNTELSESDEMISAFSQVLFSQILLSKSIKNYDLKKTITFHSNIKNSKIFVDGLYANYSLVDIFKRFIVHDPQTVYIDHIDGSFSAGRRREILDEFSRSKTGVVSNSRCLTEGVDVPVIDSIYFVDPKNSLIDIVQACGRALRKPKGVNSKTSYIVIPILIPEGIEGEELFNSDKFETVYNVVQSLRDQDTRLAQWIDLLNRQVSKGKYYKPEWTPLDFDIPQEFDLDDFERKLLTRIAIVNSEPSEKRFQSTKTYGRDERHSSYERLFRTMGDYGAESYYNNLVAPTLTKYTDPNQILNINELKVNHNNVSHTKNVGLITNDSSSNYRLTELGKELWMKNEYKRFEKIFKVQLLRYHVTDKKNLKRILFPYRILFDALLGNRRVNFLHFAYPICSVYDSSSDSIDRMMEGISFIDSEVPNSELLNEANQLKVLNELNSIWKLDYGIKDIWHKKTTLNNQWIYFRNHLLLYDDLFSYDQKKAELLVKESQLSRIRELLDETSGIVNNQDSSVIRELYNKMMRIVLFSL
jgi:superfamily II DNA or RNA helicase